jgi:hypothetical protein
MKVLYIYRKPNSRLRNLKKIIKGKLVGYFLEGQDGFFEASLFNAFPNLKYVSIEEILFKTSKIDNSYDWIIINLRCFGKNKHLHSNLFSMLKSLKSCHKALFVNNADPTFLPGENFLDVFDVIFRRELLRDLDRYNVSEKNRKKLFVTMLSCPLIKTRVSFCGNIKTKALKPDNEPVLKHDVSFIGSNSNPLRQDILLELENNKFLFYGGLYDNKSGNSLNWSGPKHPREVQKGYIETLKSSKVNMVIDGKGPFTFRHLDVWYVGGFMLSTTSILDIQLPENNPIENVHFSCFKDFDDMKDKISYYLKNDSDRIKIASAGSKYFKSIYNFEKHGKYISNILKS